MPTRKFSTFCAFLWEFSFHMRVFFTSYGRMSQKLFWILVLYFARPIHVSCFLHSCTLTFTLRSLVRCHPPYHYLIWHFLEYFAIVFYCELIMLLCCYCFLFVMVAWYILGYFIVPEVLSFHRYVGLVESHASNLTLRGWSLFRSIFSEDKGALP